MTRISNEKMGASMSLQLFTRTWNSDETAVKRFPYVSDASEKRASACVSAGGESTGKLGPGTFGIQIWNEEERERETGAGGGAKKIK